MASSTESNHQHQHHHCNPITRFIQSTSTNLSSLLIPKPPTFPLLPTNTLSKVFIPLSSPPLNNLTAFPFESAQGDSSFARAAKNMPPESGPGFRSTVRISSLNSAGKSCGGPAFVGQTWFSRFKNSPSSNLDLALSTSYCWFIFRWIFFNITPEWLKKMFAAVTKSERNGPVFRFFMDLGDAVSYVKRLNIPSGVVGACRLDLAYEHFKEKPHLFQFIPNEKQVKEANKLLKTIQQSGGRKKIDGVPVFSAQNLDIAIATTDGIKWYTPYFFDKNLLDNILEESVDQHFHGLIQTRQLQRRRDIVDDNLAAEALEESGESVWEPPEVQEVLDEMGNPGIPLSVISKAAELQLQYSVDKVLLGNRWLRKATGIQPKFPYMVDSFEQRILASKILVLSIPFQLNSENLH
ncbi:hypothetical protein RJ640_023121 [Escallonia rubra]|uniref:Tic22-like family protein n=1 Tax=Escallonia rubra TaxID=112253 RepID=A0AA88R7H2_9ASTE|nr:hypothetical protein RJ640_023121 [Escallonia rubra]